MPRRGSTGTESVHSMDSLSLSSWSVSSLARTIPLRGILKKPDKSSSIVKKKATPVLRSTLLADKTRPRRRAVAFDEDQNVSYEQPCFELSWRECHARWYSRSECRPMKENNMSFCYQTAKCLAVVYRDCCGVDGSQTQQQNKTDCKSMVGTCPKEPCSSYSSSDISTLRKCLDLDDSMGLEYQIVKYIPCIAQDLKERHRTLLQLVLASPKGQEERLSQACQEVTQPMRHFAAVLGQAHRQQQQQQQPPPVLSNVVESSRRTPGRRFLRPRRASFH